jgi:hypothetical protein
MWGGVAPLFKKHTRTREVPNYPTFAKGRQIWATRFFVFQRWKHKRWLDFARHDTLIFRDLTYCGTAWCPISARFWQMWVPSLSMSPTPRSAPCRRFPTPVWAGFVRPYPLRR